MAIERSNKIGDGLDESGLCRLVLDSVFIDKSRGSVDLLPECLVLR
jgi:hypothetical protein